ncbi:MAG: hypothetical protein WA146_06555 [Thiobacillus sp.]
MLHTDDQILSGYYKHQQTNADEDFWAWEEVDELCHDLASGLRITGKLIESAPSDWSLSRIGAGPLEDLVYRFDLPAVKAIAEIAATSERMQRAILSVNVDDDSPALAAWEVLMRKHYGDIDAL